MNKFVRSAQTSQSLSLAAMEEASRLGLRQADLEHLLLALVINEQPGGRALRSLGITMETARRAVEDQHETQLASLGIEAAFPEAGKIVFHETNGYEWSTRATDLIARASSRGNKGDASAVLRELVAEPSGLIANILDRLGTTADVVLERLDQYDTPEVSTTPPAAPTPAVKGRVSGTRQTFVPAPLDEVWEFLTDPTKIPEWEMGVGSIDHDQREPGIGDVWQGQTPTRRPDGKPLKSKPQFRRRSIDFVAADRPNYSAWRFAYPDSPHSVSVLTEFSLEPAAGGTQITITTSWNRHPGWRRLVGLPFRPAQKFLVWFALFQMGSAISRAFR